MRTYNGFQWELGKWYKKTGEGKFCSSNWLHFYNDPLVGLFLNPAHISIKNPRLFRAEVEGKFLNDNKTKCGYSRARLIEELPVPQISNVQRVRFAILCAKEVYKEKEWNDWADNWLSGKDRTEKSAASAAYTAESVTYAADSAASTAKSAESTFYATKSAMIAFYETKSTMFAFYVAESAENAVESASITTKSKKIDLVGIAQKAMEE